MSFGLTASNRDREGRNKERDTQKEEEIKLVE